MGRQVMRSLIATSVVSVMSWGIALGASSPSAFADAAAPNAPTAPAVSAGNQSLLVTWTAPADNGSAISAYTVTASDGVDPASTCSTDGSATSCVVSGLVNGTSYSVSVTATNGIGTSASSDSVSGTPAADVPSAPSGVSASSGNGSATVSWVAPADNGSPIVSYQISAVTGSDAPITTTASASDSSVVLSGLTNGLTYSITVSALNAVGTSAPSAPISVTPATSPSEPTGVTVTSGNGSLSVSWTAPDSGGSPITGYTVTAITGTDTPLTCTTSGLTTCDITGATNGSAYTVTVSATNSVGTTSTSHSVSATPSTTPDAPTISSVTYGDRSVTATWTAPSFDGGSTVTGYVMSVSDGINPAITCTTGSAVFSCQLTGLTNATAYSVTVHAVNRNGAGSESTAVSATPSTVPDAPNSVTVVRGDGALTVNWVAPTNTGGSDITGFTATATAVGYGSTSCQALSTDSSCDITGLVNGVIYSVSVVATNANGDSASSTSLEGIPAGLPSAPTGVSVSVGDSQLTIRWTASSANGSAITRYTATSDDGSSCTTTGATTCTITGLTNGTSYTITVTATNDVGDSANSLSVSARPGTVPSAPRWLHGTAGNGTATLAWNSSLSNGGSPITAYVVSDQNGHGCTTTGFTCTVTGLTNGTRYTFYVTAVNALGSSARSNANPVVPATTPGAPNIVSWAPANNQIIVTVKPPASNGGLTFQYQYSITNGATWLSAALVTKGNVITIGGLTNGTAYHIAVRAVNQMGHSDSSTVVIATPSTVPLAPVLTSLSMSSVSTVIHLGPLAANGSPISALQYSLDNGKTWRSVSATTATRSITISALPLKVTVTVVVRAVNANGASPSSVAVSARRLK